MGADYHRMGTGWMERRLGSSGHAPLPALKRATFGTLLTLSPRHLKNSKQGVRLSRNPWDCVTSTLCKELTCHQPPWSSVHQEARLVTRRRLETDITSFFTGFHVL